MVKQYNEDPRQKNKNKLNNPKVPSSSHKSKGPPPSNVAPEFKMEIIDRAKDRPLELISTPEGPFVIGIFYFLFELSEKRFFCFYLILP
jgi:hypothetical protein